MRLKRRSALKALTGLPTLLLLPHNVNSQAQCRTDPDDTGPFYRESAPQRNKIHNQHPSPDLLIVSGTIYGRDCQTPLANAIVDVWHAGPDGAYDNESDEFNFRGVVTTNSNGRYEFQTLLPGRYGSRPRHIHYK